MTRRPSDDARNPRPTAAGTGTAPGDAKELRREIVGLLTRTRDSHVDEIVRIKQLAEEYSRCAPTGLRPEDFVSGYFNVRLARLTGEAEMEKTSIRRCLEFLNINSTAELMEMIQPAETAGRTPGGSSGS
jgi:hypothetical protein